MLLSFMMYEMVLFTTSKGLSPLCYELILLVKSYGTAPCMLNTVKVLISGGAELVVPQDFDEIKVCVVSVQLIVSYTHMKECLIVFFF